MTLKTQHTSPHPPKTDLEKVKVYLVNSLTRELEENPPPLNRRREFIIQKLNQVYGQTQLKLADTLRQQVFRDVLDDLLGYGPIQPLLDDPNITARKVTLEDFMYAMEKIKPSVAPEELLKHRDWAEEFGSI